MAAISTAVKDGNKLVITYDDGTVIRRSIVYEDTVVSEPPDGSEQVGNVYVNASGDLIVNYNGSYLTISEGGGMTGAEIVAALEALGVGSRLSHTKLDDVGEDDHHAKLEGPASSTDHAIARYDGATGEKLLDSGITIDDSDDISIGANSIKTTSWLLKELDASYGICVRNVGDTAYGPIYVDGLTVVTFAILNCDFQIAVSGKGIYGPNLDDAYTPFMARRNGDTRVEIARMQGAADPYFSLGGSQEWKFYNSGAVDFNNLTGLLKAVAGAISAATIGIADDNIVEIDDADAASGDYAKLTANGLEGRDKTEMLSDLNVADGADVTGDNAPQAHKASHENGGADEVSVAGLSGLLADDQHVLDAEVLAVASDLAHKDRHDPNDGADPLDTAAPSELADVQAAGVGTSHSLARADHQHQIQHGITDNHIVTIDDSALAAGELGIWTANGIAGLALAGSTFPATPYEGMRFVHEVTGRKILYVYDADNTTWIPIISIGTMTLYVDATDGSDTLETKGIGVDSDAFATVQFAIDCIPGLVGGNITININNESYSEAVTIRGKAFTGNYTITLQGTLASAASGTSSANGTQGTGATQGVVTDTGNMAGYAGYLIYLDADGDYCIIDSSTANDATIVGCFTSQPLSGENYVIYGWGTDITSITVTSAQKGIIVNDIELTSNLVVDENAVALEVNRCKLGTNSSINAGTTYLNYCYSTGGAMLIQVINYGFARFTGCKFLTTSNNNKAVRAYNIGMIAIRGGTVIDCSSQSGSIGVQCNGNSSVLCWSTAAQGYDRIRNCATGVSATTGGQVTNTSNNQYSGNTTDEDAEAASYGYID